MSDQLDKIDKAHKDGFKAGQEHSQPSPLTRKLIKSMEDKFDNLKDKVHNFEINVVDKLSSTKSEIVKELGDAIKSVKDECDDKIKNVVEKSDKKYAGKRVEVNHDRLIWLMISTLVVSVLGLILK